MYLGSYGCSGNVDCKTETMKRRKIEREIIEMEANV